MLNYFKGWQWEILINFITRKRDKKKEGNYVYPNVIFELDKKLDLELEFPLGYSYDYSIEKNKVGRKYYLIKITE